MRARSTAEVGHWSGRCHHVRELIGDPLDQLAMLRLAAVRLLAGVTLVVFAKGLIGRWQAQNETPSDEQPSKRRRHIDGSARGY